MIGERGNFRVGIDLHKAAGKLIALADIDQPCVIFRIRMPRRKQLLQHDRHLDAIGRGQRVKLERMRAHRQGFFMGGA